MAFKRTGRRRSSDSKLISDKEILSEGKNGTSAPESEELDEDSDSLKDDLNQSHKVKRIDSRELNQSHKVKRIDSRENLEISPKNSVAETPVSEAEKNSSEFKSEQIKTDQNTSKNFETSDESTKLEPIEDNNTSQRKLRRKITDASTRRKRHLINRSGPPRSVAGKDQSSTGNENQWSDSTSE